MSERAIFEAALDRSDPAERASYLDEACGGDAEMRRRVEELLRAHALSGSFLDRPAMSEGEATESGPGPAPTQLPEGAESRIGPYKLLQQIGEGGMGTVYMAEQEKPVRRRVALKIIKRGMDCDQVVARFEAERQALALMDHPNIARVLDGGTTESGRPYFVMDLVKGIPITEYCDQARLSPRERLELFIPVCAAIQHAHQKGIIHRDVKPSNVMVTLIDGKPLPKVIDFGVAKAIDQRLTERTLFTQFGAIVGTPEYMSPEQAELSALDVDTRSDIFSLGVLLYELLTGSTPLEREKLREAGYAEVLRRIKEEEPPKPSTRISHSGNRLPSIAATRATEPARLTKLVRGELDWIVMKALAKERSRRYETASGFARDVERYLAGDPVEAGPPSTWYKMRTYARKHRAALLGSAAFVLLLIASTIVSASLAIRAMRAERTARDQAAIAQAVNDFLQQDLLGQADVDNQAMLGEKADPDIKVRTLLDRAAEKIEGKFKDQPLVEAAIRRTIGETYLCIGLSDRAEPHLGRSVALARRCLGDQHPDALGAMVSLAYLYGTQGRHSSAEPLLVAAVEGLQLVRGDEHPDTLRATRILASLYADLGRVSQAEPLFCRVLARYRRTRGENDPSALSVMLNLALLSWITGKFAQGQELAKEVIQIASITERESSNLLMADLFLSILCRENCDYDLAQVHSAKALERSRRLYGGDSYWTYACMAHQAALMARIGKTREAMPLVNDSIAGFRRMIGEQQDFTCFAKAVLGETYHADGHTMEAESLLLNAVEGWKRTMGADYSGRLLGMNPLAELYLDSRRLDRAESLLIEARGVANAMGDEGMMVADSSTALARLRVLQRMWGDAEAPARRALAIRLDRHPDHWTRFDALSLLGASLAGQGKFAEAEPMLLEAYNGLKERQERIPYLWRKKRPAEAAQRLVDLYEAWGRKGQADEWRKRVELEAELPADVFEP
jgi:serine/threonine protein kinase/tetratricopeptide (TPR) repeat protein